jgi:carbonic anhydrase/acetyltransferase-like protein (isoleucine patch superfamily)
MPIIRAYNGVSPRIANDAFIAEDAVIIGDVVIESGASIWYGCILRGDVNYIRIGKNTNIQDGSTIHVSRYEGPTVVGQGVTVGHDVTLHACTLEDHSFVGMGAIILDGAIVNTHAMLAAGGLLSPRKVIPSSELWAGTPAKLMRTLSEEEIKYIRTSENNYVELAHNYRRGGIT